VAGRWPPRGRSGAAEARPGTVPHPAGAPWPRRNRGSAAVELKVADGYRGRTATVRAEVGAVLRRTVDLSGSRRWYDLTLTSVADPSFQRRFAGHVENGRPGVSDPAIVTE
ncbi:DUF756 domain-containing protein, partial [Streptomyces sp. ID05-39B]|uniref:phospholipase domain-containing protein n=1 Tax=Streptomyces sp. ID05-39B TaxID=3028664 RepID=UPI0029B74D68